MQRKSETTINVKKIASGNKEHTTDKETRVSVLLNLFISSNDVCLRPLAYYMSRTPLSKTPQWDQLSQRKYMVRQKPALVLHNVMTTRTQSDALATIRVKG